MILTDEQIERYSRHILLPQVGGAGQNRLLNARVLIVGAGGLGSPAALYLAAAGVGTLGIIDSDTVEMSNLQRQILHTTHDLGRSKVESAGDTLRSLNPDVTVKPYPIRAQADNLPEIIRDYDFVIDGTDNFPTKFLINDACFFERKPLSHAGILQFEGQLMTILPDRSACLRCLFDAPPPADAVPSCAQAGVLGAVAGVIGSLQAIEAVKSILGIGALLTDALLTVNALTMQFRKVVLQRQTDCRLCGRSPKITALRDEGAMCSSPESERS